MARLELDKQKKAFFSGALAVALVSKTMRRTANVAKSRVPVKTGETRASIQYGFKKLTKFTTLGRVGSVLKKAHYIHEGTRRHTIRPRHRKALKFHDSAGVVRILAKVRHPGIGSTPYLTSALRDVAVPLGFKVERTLPARLRPREGTLTP